MNIEISSPQFGSGTLPNRASDQTPTFNAVAKNFPGLPQVDLVTISQPVQRFSEAKMRAAALAKIYAEASEIQLNTESLSNESTAALSANQARWNEKIIPNLNSTSQIELKDGLHSLSAEQRAEVQLRAIVKPNSIAGEIWDSIPNKHFESTNFKSNASETGFKDWSDGSAKDPNRSNNPKFNFYAGLKNNFKRLNDLLKPGSQGSSLVKEIDALERGGWEKTFSDEDLFGPPPPTLGAKNFVRQYATVSLYDLPDGTKLVENLKNLRQTLKETQRKGQAAFLQTWELGEVLRTTKSARDILRDPLYIKEKLLDPTRKALKSANPIQIPIILANFKAEVKTLLEDMCNLQSSSSETLSKTQLKEEQKVLVEGVISKIVDKVLFGLEGSLGRQITEEYGHLIGERSSPLGPLPSDGQNTQKAYENLRPLFTSVYNGQSKLSLTTVAPLLPDLFKATETEEQDLQKIQTRTLLDEKPNQSPGVEGEILRSQSDPVIEIAYQTKKAFEEVFQSSSRQKLLNVQLGFIPFDPDPLAQKKLEAILSTERFQGLAQTQTVKVANKTYELSPAILSRISYLYYRFSLEQEQDKEFQQDLAKVDL